MKIRTKIKFIQHWELFKSRYVVTLIILVAFVLSYLVLNNQSFTQKLNNVFQDPGFVGIFGSLLGALIGGLMSIFAAVYVNNKQTKSKAYIVKMNITYKPLYDELIELKSVLEQNPYPHYFSFRKGPQTIVPHPQFNAWERIKGDSRYIFVPDYIKEYFNIFYRLVDEYSHSRAITSSDIQVRVNDILFSRFETRCTIQNLGGSILKEIILKDDKKGSLFSHYFDHALSPQRTLSQEEKSDLTFHIFNECNNLETVAKLKTDYQEVLKCVEDLLFCISSVINLITKKYEEKSKFI